MTSHAELTIQSPPPDSDLDALLLRNKLGQRFDASLVTPPYHRIFELHRRIRTEYLAALNRERFEECCRIRELLNLLGQRTRAREQHPGAGHEGGCIVFEGTPADLVAARSTLTGQHLAATSAPDPTP